MSWHFSRALVAEFSEATCSDGARSALSSGNPTPPLFLPSDRTTAFSRLSRFGMTFGHLTDELGADVLMWFQAASRAKTSALQEKAPASPESAAECGATWRGSLAKFDPVSCSWKTAQLCLLEDSDESSVTWPRSGMTAGGLCWELPMSAPRISATASGLWPTPVCWDAKTDQMLGGATVYEDRFGKPRRKTPNGSASMGLARLVQHWPTPTVCGNHNRKGASATSGDGLATAVYQTPVARMWKDNGKNPSELDRNSPTLAMQAGGALNPMWVEWLMGWPLGWTDLKPSETGKSHSVPQQLGGC